MWKSGKEEPGKKSAEAFPDFLSSTSREIVFLMRRSAEAGQQVKECREGLRAAAGILDRQPGLTVLEQVVAAEDAEAHRETVVVIGLDLDAGHQRARVDFQGILRLDDVLAEFLQLARHAGDAVGLLLARV